MSNVDRVEAIYAETPVQEMDRVVRAIRNGCCLPVVGAGLSVATGFGSKPLLELVAQLPIDKAPDARAAKMKALEIVGAKVDVTDLGAPPTWFLQLCLLASLNQGDRQVSLLSAVAQQVHRKRGDVFFSELLYLLFRDPEPNSNRLHRILADLPFDIIVTTNFDDCLERARASAGDPIKVACCDKDFVNLGVTLPILLKIHGDTSTWEEPINLTPQRCVEQIKGIVLTDQQYWRFPADRILMMDYLKVVIASRLTVFLGYSLRDFNMVEQLHHLSGFQGGMRRALAIVKDASQEDIDIWHERSVDLVNCSLEVFLSEVWKKFAGIPYGEVENLPAGEGIRNYEIAAKVLMRLAVDQPFHDALRYAVGKRAFPRDKFPNNVWSAGKHNTFASKKWFRILRADGDDNSCFYEWPYELRELVKNKLAGTASLKRGVP